MYIYYFYIYYFYIYYFYIYYFYFYYFYFYYVYIFKYMYYKSNSTLPTVEVSFEDASCIMSYFNPANLLFPSAVGI